LHDASSLVIEAQIFFAEKLTVMFSAEVAVVATSFVSKNCEKGSKTTVF